MQKKKVEKFYFRIILYLQYNTITFIDINFYIEKKINNN